MTVLWVAYRTDTNLNPFGRDFVGYLGWHDNATSALKEAAIRFPDVPSSVIQVNRA